MLMWSIGTVGALITSIRISLAGNDLTMKLRSSLGAVCGHNLKFLTECRLGFMTSAFRDEQFLLQHVLVVAMHMYHPTLCSSLCCHGCDVYCVSG